MAFIFILSSSQFSAYISQVSVCIFGDSNYPPPSRASHPRILSLIVQLLHMCVWMLPLDSSSHCRIVCIGSIPQYRLLIALPRAVGRWGQKLRRRTQPARTSSIQFVIMLMSMHLALWRHVQPISFRGQATSLASTNQRVVDDHVTPWCYECGMSLWLALIEVRPAVKEERFWPWKLLFGKGFGIVWHCGDKKHA